MLKVAVIDANNTKKTEETLNRSSISVVAEWIEHEIRQGGLEQEYPEYADIIFLVHAGSIDWLGNCRPALKRKQIDYLTKDRRREQYVIAGGGVASTPLTGFLLADAIAVGEAYNYVRGVLKLVRDGGTIADIVSYTVTHPHAIEASQVEGIERDSKKPWLLKHKPAPLASPDNKVDWDTPPVMSNDGCVRVVASKGCRTHCAFCNTSWSQDYQYHPNGWALLNTLKQVKRYTDKDPNAMMQLITNDFLDLPYAEEIQREIQLGHQSITVRQALEKGEVFLQGMKIARFGIEGLSPRIRKAWGKPIENDTIIELLAYIHGNKICPSHLFFIPAAPYETDEDWESLKELYAGIAESIDWAITRFKFTSFVPDPPAPLMRFVPATIYVQRMDDFFKWIVGNMASRHIVSIRPKQVKTKTSNIADAMSCDPEAITGIMSETKDYDLAPTLEEFERMPTFLVEWPFSPQVLFNRGEKYKKLMGV